MNRRRAAFAIASAALVLLMGGCAAADNLRSYGTVRQEAIDALQSVVDQLPADAVASPRAEQDPYSCSDSVGVADQSGVFYTGTWDVTVPEDFDIGDFVDTLPGELGNDWTVDASIAGLNLDYVRVDLINQANGVQLSVSDTTAHDDSPSLGLTAISACGADPTASE